MNTLHDVKTVAEMIGAGKAMMLAGDEALLRELPRGRWIGGTIPYFMVEEGGTMSRERLQVFELPDFARDVRIRRYLPDQLEKIPSNYAPNGVSLIVIPAQSRAHETFARDCSSYKGIFDRPLVGWITGVALTEVGRRAPLVFDGTTGEGLKDEALVMHFDLPPEKEADVDIVNLFEPGGGDVLTFPEIGFTVRTCFVNGQRRNFAEYLLEKGVDTRLPLVAEYMGARINVSFQSVSADQRSVTLYAPVFPMIEYRVASPLQDYEARFAAEVAHRGTAPAFACNCILNYVHANLEGKKTAGFEGPITFGEIAYMLLNQTLVYLDLRDR